MSKWANLYKLSAWQKRRMWQLRHYPLCSRCSLRGVVIQATVAHHVEPHEGVWEKFISGKLESLCKRCHDSSAQSEEALGYRSEIGLDGWPVDVRADDFVFIKSKRKNNIF